MAEISPEKAALIKACQDVTTNFNSIPHAIGGVAGCVLLGSERVTHNLDIVVQKRNKSAAKKCLLKKTQFKRGFWPWPWQIWYIASDEKKYKINILKPQRIDQDHVNFDSDTISTQKATVLKPAFLLNHRFLFWYSHIVYSMTKSDNDAKDIIFLLKYLEKNKITVWEPEAPFAESKSRVFTESYPDTGIIWENVISWPPPKQ